MVRASIKRMFNETVVILRAAPVADRYGSQSSRQRNWADAVETTVRAGVQPNVGSETTGDRDQVASGIRVWLPAGTDVTVVDRIRWDGKTFEVDGEPLPWRPPRGRSAHLEILARQVKG